MGSNGRLALCTVLALLLVEAAMVVRAEDANLLVTNGLSSGYLYLECPHELDPGNKMKPGESLGWSSVMVDNRICMAGTALGEKLYPHWQVYDPKRDAGKTSVFWIVKDDGFYLSYDKQCWEKKHDW